MKRKMGGKRMNIVRKKNRDGKKSLGDGKKIETKEEKIMEDGKRKDSGTPYAILLFCPTCS
jgi:hypothetical protein